MNDIELKYFRDNWKPDYSKFKYSGWALLDKIKPDDCVLDIGCGYNLFKEKLGDRLWGIDPSNDKADEQETWERFVSHKDFNVYLALGSLNFGTEEQVEAQVKKLAYVTKPGDRIYWRQNPGTGDHPWKGVENVSFFPWSFEKNEQWCKKYNFELKDIKQDSGNRIYAEWIKRGANDKVLLLNGCSFAKQWNMSDTMINKLGCTKLENISKVGTSFQRTCRTTIEWIAKNGSPEYVVIPITFSHRWELAIADEQNDFGPWFPMQNKDHVFTTGIKIRDDVSKDKLTKLLDLYYGCIPTSVTYDGKIFTEIIMLSAFLESRDIKHLFFDMCNEFNKQDIEQFEGFEKVKFLEENKNIVNLFSFCGNRYMHNTLPNKEDVWFNTHHEPTQYAKLEKYLLNYVEKRHDQ